jgi:hypothetical protein
VLDSTQMRPHTRHDRLPERMWVAPAMGGLVVAALLATTLVLPTVSDRSVILALTVVVAVVLLGALTLAWPSSNTRGPLNTAGQLVLHLTPIRALLMSESTSGNTVVSRRTGVRWRTN